MKKLQILLLIIFSFATCKADNNTVTIKGTVIGTGIEKIQYFSIFENTNKIQFKETITPDSLGNFIVSANIDSPCLTCFMHNGQYKRVILEAGKIYEIEINRNEIKFISKKSEVQAFYENLPDLDPRAIHFHEQGLSNYKDIHKGLNDKLNKELIELNKIDCSDDVRNLIKIDRQVYYSLAVSTLASILRGQYSRNNEPIPNDITEMIEESTCLLFNSDSITKKATHFYALLNNVLWSKVLALDDYNNIKNIRKEKRKKGLTLTYNLELVREFLPTEDIEFFTASLIQDKALQNKFEKELIQLFEKFKSDFPNSKYTPFIKPHVDKIIQFHNIAKQGFESNIKFIDNYKNINSLEECLKPFKGKKVYIDVWATSCGACKKQFAYNAELKKILKAKGVDIIYISKDRDDYDERWKGMIKYYDLTGNHIRANRELKLDLKKIVGRSGIPIYFIIDENGKVINNNAPRPSNLTELRKLL